MGSNPLCTLAWHAECVCNMSDPCVRGIKKHVFLLPPSTGSDESLAVGWARMDLTSEGAGAGVAPARVARVPAWRPPAGAAGLAMVWPPGEHGPSQGSKGTGVAATGERGCKPGPVSSTPAVRPLGEVGPSSGSDGAGMPGTVGSGHGRGGRGHDGLQWRTWGTSS